MRIVQILEATLGGTARHVLDLCAGLRRAGHEVHLLYNPREGRQDAIFRAGIPRLEELGVHIVAIDMPRAVQPLADARIVLAVRRYLRRHGPFDVIHGHSSKAGAYTRLAAIGLPGARIYTPHALVTMNPELRRAARFAYGAMERVLARFGNAVIAVSDEERAEARRLGVAASFVVANGADIDVRRRDGSRDNVTIGTVGRLVPQKAPLQLLRAFALLRRDDVQLAIVGSGPLEAEARAAAESLGIASRVQWLGAIDGPSAMASFDVFALASLYEGFPYVLIEAMHLGLPIVTTAIGGATMLVEDGVNGFVVPVAQPELFAQVLQKLVDDSELRRAMSAASLARAQQFTAARMVADTLAVYETVAR